eukprot:s2122_g16.t1
MLSRFPQSALIMLLMTATWIREFSDHRWVELLILLCPGSSSRPTMDATMGSIAPTGLKGKLAALEEHYQGQLQELKKTMDEVKRHFAQQKAENARLQQQITTLKGEKTSLQQQILGLQRRIQEIEEQVGAD